MKYSAFSIVFALLLFSNAAFGSADSIGPKGIDATNLLGLTGNNIGIGQVETRRPGDPDFDTNGALFNMKVNPTQVYYWQGGTNFTATMSVGIEVSEHGVEVAGAMISTDSVSKGEVDPIGWTAK